MTATQMMRKKNRTATAIRFPDQLHDRLRATAEQYDFSINYLVVKAVEDFLPRMIPAEELKLTRDSRSA
jgi:predicted transcriptional regulator